MKIIEGSPGKYKVSKRAFRQNADLEPLLRLLEKLEVNTAAELEAVIDFDAWVFDKERSWT